MKSTVHKRSILIGGHKTSVSLEDQFWQELQTLARVRRQSASCLIGLINSNRGRHNLSSAIRLFILGHYRSLHHPATVREAA